MEEDYIFRPLPLDTSEVLIQPDAIEADVLDLPRAKTGVRLCLLTTRSTATVRFSLRASSGARSPRPNLHVGSHRHQA